MSKILIVDDSTELAEFLETLLRQYKFETRTLTSHNTILANVEEFQPDVILMDVRLGNMDGRDICRKIKSIKSVNPPFIVLLSASADLLHDYQQCEADGVVEKPFNMHDLLEKINNLIRLRNENSQADLN